MGSGIVRCCVKCGSDSIVEKLNSEKTATLKYKCVDCGHIDDTYENMHYNKKTKKWMPLEEYRAQLKSTAPYSERNWSG